MVEPLPSASLGRSATHARVLVVEDDADLRCALRDAFQMYGFVVNVTRDGAAALNMALHDTYDVVVSDIRLPGMSGVELTRRLSCRCPGVRVVLITAYPAWQVYREAHDAGAVKVVSKPFTLAKLAQTVEQIAGRECSA